MLLFTIILGVISGSRINTVNNDYDISIDAHLAPLKAVMEAEVAFANVRQTSRGFIIRVTEDSTEYEHQRNKLYGILNIMKEKTDALAEVFSGLDMNDATIKNSLLIARELQHQLDAYRPLVDSIVKTTKRKNLTETVRTLNESNKITEAIHNNIIRIYELNIVAFDSVKGMNYSKVSSTIIEIILIIILSIAIGIIFAAIMSKVFGDKARWYEDLLDAFVDNPISVTDINKNVTFLNKAALTVLGKTREEVMDKHCGQV
jgi:transcriptional regulator with PAS, ATPase and Fis domain